jgi:conjugal transfer pilus assembly protein TraB
VIVGVDAASNVSSQADPLPVVLRITGPARSVSDRGRVLTTRLQGCLVNGSARGDLSSEKVYVRLARLTCPQPGGRFAESEVKGFIAFGGKVGVRGRVVSREGSLATQAFLAGLVGGIGRGFGANTQGFLNGGTTVVNGKRESLSATDIAQAGIGEGVSQAGDQVSKYLIERAEQYQPVIEMPTGIDVEIVFLEGVTIRN